MDVKRILDLQRAGVDAEGTLGRFAGNSALYEKYLMKFPLDGTFAKIGPALRAGEWDAALNAVHTLKGISGNLEMDRLCRACTGTAVLLRSGDHPAAEGSYGELRSAHREIIALLCPSEEE